MIGGYTMLQPQRCHYIPTEELTEFQYGVYHCSFRNVDASFGEDVEIGLGKDSSTHVQSAAWKPHVL